VVQGRRNIGVAGGRRSMSGGGWLGAARRRVAEDWRRERAKWSQKAFQASSGVCVFDNVVIVNPFCGIANG
jgi:hypothetical protein